MSDYKWERYTRSSGLLEWLDEDGVGHPDIKSAYSLSKRYDHKISVWLSHGCNGKCRRDDFPGKLDEDNEDDYRILKEIILEEM